MAESIMSSQARLQVTYRVEYVDRTTPEALNRRLNQFSSDGWRVITALFFKESNQLTNADEYEIWLERSA